MERTKYWSMKKILEPLTQNDLHDREKRLAFLMRGERKKPGSLRLYIFRQTEHVISVGIKGSHSGMWLFDANSDTEAEALYQDGLVLINNKTDMLLESETATIVELNSRLPKYLLKYYPDLAILFQVVSG